MTGETAAGDRWLAGGGRRPVVGGWGPETGGCGGGGGWRWRVAAGDRRVAALPALPEVKHPMCCMCSCRLIEITNWSRSGLFRSALSS